MLRRRAALVPTFAAALGVAAAAVVVGSSTPAGAITGHSCPAAGCPQISGYDGAGHPQAGRVLSTTNGTFTGTAITYTYAWQHCTSSSSTSSCSNIPDATNQEYIPSANPAQYDVTNYLRVVVTGHDGAGASASEPSTITPVVDSSSPGLTPPGTGGGNFPPVVTVMPAASNPADGIPRIGDTLTSTDATFNAPPADTTAYQWTRCNSGGTSCAPISGVAATSSPKPYVVTSFDVGKTIRMRARGSNANGTSELYSSPTGVVENTPGSPIPTPMPSGGAGGDKTPPQTRFTHKPSAHVTTTASRATVRFSFTANEPSHFQCKLDRGPWRSCHSPAKLIVSASKAGTKHTFKVRAIDAAGNVDPTPSSFTFTAKRTTQSTHLARTG